MELRALEVTTGCHVQILALMALSLLVAFIFGVTLPCIIAVDNAGSCLPFFCCTYVGLSNVGIADVALSTQRQHECQILSALLSTFPFPTTA